MNEIRHGLSETTHNEILFRHKKNEIWLLVTTWMVLESRMLSERSQTSTLAYHFICEVYKITQMNANYGTETDSDIDRTTNGYQ